MSVLRAFHRVTTCVVAPLDIGATRRLSAWVDALDELAEEAKRCATRPAEPGTSIAILHALEERAHRAFDEYRAYLLGQGMAGLDSPGATQP